MVRRSPRGCVGVSASGARAARPHEGGTEVGEGTAQPAMPVLPRACLNLWCSRPVRGFPLRGKAGGPPALHHFANGAGAWSNKLDPYRTAVWPNRHSGGNIGREAGMGPHAGSIKGRDISRSAGTPGLQRDADPGCRRPGAAQPGSWPGPAAHGAAARAAAAALPGDRSG